MAKGIATLAAIDQHEYQLKVQSESVSHAKLVVLPSQIEEKKLDSSQ